MGKTHDIKLKYKIKTYNKWDRNSCTLKPVLNGHSQKDPKIGFQDQLLLNARQKICILLMWSILQYFDFHEATTCHLDLCQWPLKMAFTVLL